MNHPHLAKDPQRGTPSPQTGEHPSLAKTYPKAPISQSPSSSVVVQMMDAASRYRSFVTPACLETVEAMFRRGHFVAGLDLLSRKMSGTGGQPPMALLQTLRGLAVAALEQRLGDLNQLVIPNAGNTPFEVSFSRVLALAAEHPTLENLLRREGSDRLHTLELVVRLVQTGWLLLTPAPRSQHVR